MTSDCHSHKRTKYELDTPLGDGSVEELLTARSRQCIPYMDPQMSSKETKEDIFYFMNDKRISF